MEGNCSPATLYSTLPPSVKGIGRSFELHRWNSDASSLTGEDGKDVFCCSEAVKMDEHSVWTAEKHKVYLQRLEMSFVKQLQQSKRFLAKCSEQNKRGSSISMAQLINDSNQVNCVTDDPLSRSILADSQTPSDGMPGFLKLCSTVIIPQHDFPTNNALQVHGNIDELTREGMGQNYLDEDDQSTSNYEPPEKRSKTCSFS